MGGVFNAVNPSVYEFRERGVPAKQAYLRKDLRTGRGSRASRSVPADRVPGQQRQGDARLHHARAGRASWCRSPPRSSRPTGRDDEDISRDEVLAAICERVGVDPGRFFAGISPPAVKEQLKANTDELIARGGFGRRPCSSAQDDMYFGNDRLGLVREAVLRRKGVRPG